MSFFLATLLKPFAAVAFLTVAFLIARGLYRLIPSGRVRDILYDRTLRNRHPWRFGALVIFCYLAVGTTLWAVFY